MRIPFIMSKKAKASIDSDFRSIVEGICKDGGSGTYHLYRRTDDASRKFLHVTDGEVKDLRDIDPEHWIRVSFGGGEYQLRIDRTKEKGDEEIVRTFNFNIEGEPKETRYEIAKKKETETSTMLEILKTSFDYAEKLKGGNSEMAMIVAIMQEATKQTSMMFGQMIEMQNKSHESMLRLMKDQKDSTNPVTEALENIMQLKEVESMMSPKIDRDGTLEWFKALSNSPLLAGLASKVMNVELPQGQQIPMIPAQLPGSIDGNGHKPINLANKENINLGSPSDTPINSKLNPLLKTDQKANPFVSPSSDNKIEYKPDDFETNMIDPLLDAISAGVDAPNIAVIINQIIQWSVTLARIEKEVHPLMKGFVDFILRLGESDIDFNQLDKIYVEFCSGIEMPKELISPVKEELLKYYMPVFQQIMAERNKKAKEIIGTEKEVNNESAATA